MHNLLYFVENQWISTQHIAMCKLITSTNYQQDVSHNFYRCDIELTTSPAYGKVIIGTGTVDDSEGQVDVFINQQTNAPA